MTIPFTKKWLQQQAERIIGRPSFAPMFTGRNVVWIDDKVSQYIEQGYSMNDTVYSISQITSEKIKVAPWNVYKVVDESSLKQMKSLQKEGKPENHKKILDLKTKALEIYNGDARLNELLQWPNENESFQDLVAHSAVSKMMTGNRFVQGLLLENGANAGKPYELYLLPPQYVNIITNGSYPIRTESYQLNCSVPIPMNKEWVLHDKYYNPNYDNYGSHLYGLAPLKAARQTLTNDNSSNEASTKSFQNMGPGGALFIDDNRISGEEAAAQSAAVKKKWVEEYSGTSNAKKIVVSGYKLGWQEMGLSPVDLQIIEQQKWNLIKFCNVWNFPHIMLLADHATDNNVGWAEKALTSRCALPLLTSFRENFNRKLQTDWGYKGQNIYIDYDQSVYSELDVDRKDASSWINESYELTLRQRYELKNIEIPQAVENLYGELLDRIYLPSGYMDLKDVAMPELNETDISNSMGSIPGQGG